MEGLLGSGFGALGCDTRPLPGSAFCCCCVIVLSPKALNVTPWVRPPLQAACGFVLSRDGAFVDALVYLASAITRKKAPYYPLPLPDLLSCCRFSRPYRPSPQVYEHLKPLPFLLFNPPLP